MDTARSDSAEWFLGDAEEQHRAHPRTFFIPSRSQREALAVGDWARLTFVLRNPAVDGPSAERMWVVVSEVAGSGYVGELTNEPVAMSGLGPGDLVRFEPEHVIAVIDPWWAPYEGKVAFANRRLVEDDGLDPGFVVHDPSDEQLPPLPVSSTWRPEGATTNGVQATRSDGRIASGWQLLVGDETEEELEDPSNVLLPHLPWLMERYPAFGALVASGTSGGEWLLDEDTNQYVPCDD